MKSSLNSFDLLKEAFAKVSPIYNRLLLIRLPGLFVTAIIPIIIFVFFRWDFKLTLDCLNFFPLQIGGLNLHFSSIASSDNPDWFLPFILSISFLPLFYSGTIAPVLDAWADVYSYQQLTQPRGDYGRAFEQVKSNGWQLAGSVLVTNVIFGGLLGLGLWLQPILPNPFLLNLIFLVVEILLIVRLIFARYPVLFEGRTAIEGLTRSWQLVGQRWGSIYGIYSLIGGINFAVSMLLRVIIQPPGFMHPIMQPVPFLDPFAKLLAMSVASQTILFFLAPVFSMAYLLTYLKVSSEASSGYQDPLE